jgi:hypothetical protein
MALIRDILRLKWPGRAWSIKADDYQTLVWSQENADAKPDEATSKRRLAAATPYMIGETL